MRVIKFKLFKGNQLQGIVELKPGGIIDVAYDWDEARQFIGLKGKDGKEIYDGDILKVNGKDVTVPVYWDESMFKFKIIYLPKPWKIGWHAFTFGSQVEGECEVIGDIHTTPELLQKQGSPA